MNMSAYACIGILIAYEVQLYTVIDDYMTMMTTLSIREMIAKSIQTESIAAYFVLLGNPYCTN